MSSKPKKVDPRFQVEEGLNVFNGSELLVKGALETPGGVHLLTGYPGSPVSEFFDVLTSLKGMLEEHGVRAQIANNEALSIAAVNGAVMLGLRAMTVFKSVGLHVASDGLALGNLGGVMPGSGAVVVVGDDPWCDSTQVPADSRFLFEHHRVPIIEPSTPQEVKDLVPLAFDISSSASLYAGFIITTTLADGGGTVELGQNHWPKVNQLNPLNVDSEAIPLEERVLLPPRTWRQEMTFDDRFKKAAKRARELGVNRIEGPSGGHLPVGLAAAGTAYQYLVQALLDLGLWGKLPILKLGMSYPVDSELVGELAKQVDHIVVVEERRSFIERQITELLSKGQMGSGKMDCRVWGKNFPDGQEGFPTVRGLHPSIVAQKLAGVLGKLLENKLDYDHECFAQQLKVSAETSRPVARIPLRPPTFCPGCPHRDSSSILLEVMEDLKDAKYMRRRHGLNPLKLICHGDTGCYTLLMFPPNEQLMHNYSGMGLGGGTGAGIDPFVTNKQLVFMGDSTFFHSGQAAISNSLFGGQDITYIILDNHTTGMTGHQTHAGVGLDLLNNQAPAQDIETILRASLDPEGCLVVRADPHDRKAYRQVLEETILRDGVKVIIADRECAIVSNRRIKRERRTEEAKRGYIRKRHYTNISEEVCEYCLRCTSLTACPGFSTVETDYGLKTQTDLSWCVGDGTCEQIGACPAIEQITVIRKRPFRTRSAELHLEKFPAPEPLKDKHIWRAHIGGVGGMGIGVATSILVRAGFQQGYRVLFADKKGMAIRNGGVYSQIVFAPAETPVSQIIPYGQADLLLGIDILEAGRAIQPELPFRVCSPERTVAVLNTDLAPTTGMLLGKEDFQADELLKDIADRSRPDGFLAINVTKLCERLLATKLHMNMALLGAAFQKGYIPVSEENMRWAIQHTIRRDFRKNLRAFNLGRKLIARPQVFSQPREIQTLAKAVRERAVILERTRWGGKGLSRAYKLRCFKALRNCRGLGKQVMKDWAIRIYDLIQYQGLGYADEYIRKVQSIYGRDKAEQGYAATEAVIRNLAKLMMIKDVFYVSYLLSRYEKLKRDRQRYQVNAAGGDKIRYRRVFHPRVLGHRLDIWLPQVANRVMARLKFMRVITRQSRQKERVFLNWYLELIENFGRDGRLSYNQEVDILQAPEIVRGYAELRDEKMAQAMQKVKDVTKTPQGKASA